MKNSNLYYRCYFLPLIAAIFFYIISYPVIYQKFEQWIPDYDYCLLCKAFILFIVLYISCRIIDLSYDTHCHDSNCDKNLDLLCSHYICKNDKNDENKVKDELDDDEDDKDDNLNFD